ncbi:rhomboid family protein [Aspergillus bombycis]|uniref:Rhomboid family protein n=1 Tax=Aspergillus bombycis TaxID=109264 RepID=A0A1F7ZWI1_9EURO|nr:rhomboid family protein [Aspergillus bombycis]OGM43797.1 rhomboid family protein [Aspergillus bombycis]
MSNVLCITWRIPCSGPRSLSLLPSNPASLRSTSCVSSPWHHGSIFGRRLGPLSLFPPTTPYQSCSRTTSTQPPSSVRLFTSSRCLRTKPIPKVEYGVQLRQQPFSTAEINAVFGSRARITPQLGNRILAILQGRRLDGTLDLDLPSDITRSIRPSSLDAALQWLRKNYPLDEDAAILARIEREELQEEEKLVRRAEELGLYKPQSGSYGAELGDSNDPYGKSVLKETRTRNEARLLAKQEKKRQEWLDGEQEEREKLEHMRQKNMALQRFEDTASLEVRERADPNQRPLLAWIQKHHLRATDWDLDVSKLTNGGRIFRILSITLVTFGLCYFFSNNYQAPAKADRLWPDIPPAAATVMAIIGTNVGVFLLWKLCPPAWRLLNRHFITVAAYPRPLSLIGNVFSHQTVNHLALNMVVLWFVGTRLHDEIGRGNFLALYLASGVFGSFTSLTANILKGNLGLTALGASGAISALVAAWCMLHADEKFTFFFLPPDWQEVASAKGWMVLTGLVALEFVNMFTRRALIDYWAHLGGFLAGALWSTAYKMRKGNEQRINKTWFERTFRD